jgi:hypothetical protein
MQWRVIVMFWFWLFGYLYFDLWCFSFGFGSIWLFGFVWFWIWLFGFLMIWIWLCGYLFVFWICICFNKYFGFVFRFVNFVPKGKMSKNSAQNRPKTGPNRSKIDLKPVQNPNWKVILTPPVIKTITVNQRL